MVAYQKFNSFAEAVYEKVHNLGLDTLKLMLSNSAPIATNTVKVNITEITAGNGYTAGGETLTITDSSQTAGTYSLTGNNIVITASGGSIGPFQYVVLYNDSATNDELIGFWDNSSAITLATGESVTLDLDQVNGILQHS